jgi:hypothetical protein
MTRLMKTLLLTGVVGAGLLAMGTGAARADIIPHLVSVTPDGPNFRWTYEADLTNNERLDLTKNVAFFTIYDFAGLVPGTNMQPMDWAFSSALVGVTPPKILPTDDPAIPNLTWTYTGSAVIGPGPLNLGDFSADSIYSAKTSVDFASLATKNTVDDKDGTSVQNDGSVSAPFVPEPGTMMILGLGIAPMIGALRRRGRMS